MGGRGGDCAHSSAPMQARGAAQHAHASAHLSPNRMQQFMHACGCACVSACVRACVRACMWVPVCACGRACNGRHVLRAPTLLIQAPLPQLLLQLLHGLPLEGLGG